MVKSRISTSNIKMLHPEIHNISHTYYVPCSYLKEKHGHNSIAFPSHSQPRHQTQHQQEGSLMTVPLNSETKHHRPAYSKHATNFIIYIAWIIIQLNHFSYSNKKPQLFKHDKIKPYKTTMEEIIRKSNKTALSNPHEIETQRIW